jgi:hypothetical protein
MTKDDVRITISSASGKNIYIQALISRTVARRIETLLEQNNVGMLTPYTSKKHRELM